VADVFRSDELPCFALCGWLRADPVKGYTHFVHGTPCCGKGSPFWSCSALRRITHIRFECVILSAAPYRIPYFQVPKGATTSPNAGIDEPDPPKTRSEMLPAEEMAELAPRTIQSFERRPPPMASTISFPAAGYYLVLFSVSSSIPWRTAEMGSR